MFSLFLVFSEDGGLQPVFRRCYWCFFSFIIFNWSSMIIISIFVLTVFTSLDSAMEFSELIVLHIDWLSLSKLHALPTIFQFLVFRISLLRRILIISFLVVISYLKNSISFSSLVINIWYSIWLCKFIFCFTWSCMKSHISIFISLIFCM